MFSGKFEFTYFVHCRKVRLRRSYPTVYIYFIKSSGNSVPWYFNAKVSIRSFKDCGYRHKSILFWFITNLSVFLAVVSLVLPGGFLVVFLFLIWHYINHWVDALQNRGMLSYYPLLDPCLQNQVRMISAKLNADSLLLDLNLACLDHFILITLMPLHSENEICLKHL